MDTAAALESLQQPYHHLTILQLANHDPSHTRDSASSAGSAITNPHLLAADLAHYRDLFSKLRFSYVEQVTKERFLRALTNNPPDFVDAEENRALETQLAQDKSALKAKKEEVAALVRELEDQGRSLAERYEELRFQTARLEELPGLIEGLQHTIAELQEEQEPASSTNTDPALRMPLAPTMAHLTEREQRLADLDAEIDALRARDRREEIERLQDEIAPLQTKKIKVVGEAQEARRRRQDGRGGLGDGLEEKGRWLRESEARLREVLEV